MRKLWSPLLNDLSPYIPGEQPKDVADMIKLNTNENPYPPSEEVVKMLQSCDMDSLRLYPDPSASKLKKALADYFDVGSENLFIGNGSDEVLAFSFMAFFKQQQPILFADITYSFYPVYCQLFEIDYEEIPLRQGFQLEGSDYNKKNGGIIIVNPNAPTGIALPLDEIENILKNNPDSVVIIDEAYVDFGTESAIALTRKYPNLLVVQTFSKSRSLAGLRIGYAVGDTTLIEGLERVKNSFNSYPVDQLAVIAGIASLQDEAYFQQTCQAMITSRQKMVTQLEALGFSVLPSKANFVFAKHGTQDAKALYLALKERNILVRHFNRENIDGYLRISVGTPEEMAQLVEVLARLI